MAFVQDVIEDTTETCRIISAYFSVAGLSLLVPQLRKGVLVLILVGREDGNTLKSAQGLLATCQLTSRYATGAQQTMKEFGLSSVAAEFALDLNSGLRFDTAAEDRAAREVLLRSIRSGKLFVTEVRSAAAGPPSAFDCADRSSSMFLSCSRLTHAFAVHAKQYIGDHCFLNGSANFSRNGLTNSRENGTLSACLPFICGGPATLVSEADVQAVKDDFDASFGAGERVEAEIAAVLEESLVLSPPEDARLRLLELTRPRFSVDASDALAAGAKQPAPFQRDILALLEANMVNHGCSFLMADGVLGKTVIGTRARAGLNRVVHSTHAIHRNCAGVRTAAAADG